MPYQGKALGPSQPRQFPRVAYESRPGAAPFGLAVLPWGAASLPPVPPPAGPVAAGVDPLDAPSRRSSGTRDPVANIPVVPAAVKLAVLHQADSVLAGNRESRLSAQHDGVAADVTGSLSEATAAPTARASRPACAGGRGRFCGGTGCAGGGCYKGVNCH